MNEDALRKKYSEEIKKRFAHDIKDETNQEFVQRQLDSAKHTVIQRFLTKEARERLNNVRAAKPELVETVELAIVEAVQAGSLREEIDEEKLKHILEQASTQKKFHFIK